MDAESRLKRSSMRTYYRQRRRALTPHQQRLASEKILCQVKDFAPYQRASCIAVYLAADGEVDLSPLVEDAWRENKTVYLPVIHPFSKGHLLFLAYHQYTPLRPNKYQLLEPQLDVTQVIPPSALDLIITPLVAFDAQGNRLGMGGGYYDRTLASLCDKPMTVAGVAHDCQRAKELPVERWDIPLSYIITPSDIINDKVSN